MPNLDEICSAVPVPPVMHRSGINERRYGLVVCLELLRSSAHPRLKACCHTRFRNEVKCFTRAST